MVVDMTEIPKLDLDPFGNALFNFRNDLMRTFLESRAFSASKRFLIDQDFKEMVRAVSQERLKRQAIRKLHAVTPTATCPHRGNSNRGV